MLYQPIVTREHDADGHCRWRYAGAEALVRAESGEGLTVVPNSSCRSSSAAA